MCADGNPPLPRPPPYPAQFVEKHCLSGGAGEAAGGKFAVNAAVVREYLTALVKTGRLSEFGDAADAAPEQGQSHRSLAQLLAELQAVAGGGAPAAAPGATLARPLHVIVQAQVGAAPWARQVRQGHLPRQHAQPASIQGPRNHLPWPWRRSSDVRPPTACCRKRAAASGAPSPASSGPAWACLPSSTS